MVKRATLNQLHSAESRRSINTTTEMKEYFKALAAYRILDDIVSIWRLNVLEASQEHTVTIKMTGSLDKGKSACTSCLSLFSSWRESFDVQ